MAYTQNDLDQLDAAIASGELTASYNGRMVTHRSIDDLLKARAHVLRVLQAQGGARRAPTFGGASYSLANFNNQ